MGGTTAKICLIDDGEPHARAALRGGPPLPLPQGKRACRSGCRWSRWSRSARAGARLRRWTHWDGSRSGRRARAPHPGRPATGRVAPRRTVTDADLLLGRIDPEGFAGGRITLGPGGGKRGGGRAHCHAARPRSAARRIRRCGDRRGEHGERCAGARRRARQGARRAHADRLRRRRPAARGAAGGKARDRARV